MLHTFFMKTKWAFFLILNKTESDILTDDEIQKCDAQTKVKLNIPQLTLAQIAQLVTVHKKWAIQS